MNNMYDMIIVGGGPAGLSAAIYMARAKYRVLVLEKEKIGGQITITEEIVNYPGVIKTSGKKLTNDMQKQAEHFGVEFKISEVLDVDTTEDIKTVKTSSGEYKAISVLLAIGASPRKAGFTGEEDFAGRGVAYCATCDGEFFTGKPIYVVGGGFAAVEEGMFLTKYATNVEMIVRGDNFSCAQSIVDEVEKEEKINVNFNSEIVSVSGDNCVTTIKVRNKNTDEIKEVKHENGLGVFVFAGYEPNTKWLNEKIELDNGYIITNSNMETSVKGIYGAGDVCIKELRQVVTAVSDGALAATSAEKYVASIHKKLDIPFFDVQQKEIKEEKQEVIIESSSDDKFLSAEIKEQLMPVFEKFENKILITAFTDDSNLGLEMKGFINEFQNLSSKIDCKIDKLSVGDMGSYIEISNVDNKKGSIKFFAMPGGHEFNSFILAMYNVAGPGQEITKEDKERISNINSNLDIKVLMSLTCTMCPDLVVAACKVASINTNVSVSIVDISHHPDMKEKYNVMSVPCMIINDSNINFGKKSITQIIDIIESI
ncbi:MAG: FAD-dependent oxidoreductase [bacterium]